MLQWPCFCRNLVAPCNPIFQLSLFSRHRVTFLLAEFVFGAGSGELLGFLGGGALVDFFEESFADSGERPRVFVLGTNPDGIRGWILRFLSGSVLVDFFDEAFADSGERPRFFVVGTDLDGTRG